MAKQRRQQSDAAMLAQAEIEISRALSDRALTRKRRARLRERLAAIWAQQTATRETPERRVIQYFFEIIDGDPIPRLPIDRTGKHRAADGERILTLRQTARRTGWSEAKLRDRYHATWGDYRPGGAR